MRVILMTALVAGLIPLWVGTTLSIGGAKESQQWLGVIPQYMLVGACIGAVILIVERYNKWK